ncbi:MAG: ArgE/DapE family deacylase [Longimicrobiales bacterium]|nr:ArgE/DapE family deacylase [Longimicrobiales bacterium]
MTGRPLTDLERRVLDRVDVDALLEALADLVALDTSGGRETPAQEYVAGLMADLGLETDVWELDLESLREDPSYSEELGRERALGVVGRFGAGSFAEPGPGPTLVLNGHVDVVPAGDPARWTVPPFEVTGRNHRVYGRGTADMKGGLLCALFAVRAIRDAGVELDGAVLVQSVVGEEDGGLGTLAAVRRGHTGHGAIVLEPTRLVLAPAQAGAFNFRVTIPGRAAHGALREEGVDPIARFLPIYRALRVLERKRNAEHSHPMFDGQTLPWALCVGTVRAGIWASTVAESLTFEGRLGVAPDEDPGVARWELETAVAQAHEEAADGDAWLLDHPPVVEWWGGQFAPAATDPDAAVVTTTRDAFAAVTGAPPEIRGMPYGADMRLLANEGGTPTVLFGPGDVRRAHAPDEWVEIAELETAAKVVALTALRFCGVG